MRSVGQRRKKVPEHVALLDVAHPVQGEGEHGLGIDGQGVAVAVEVLAHVLVVGLLVHQDHVGEGVQGVGLGLAVCQRIIRSHGGRIRVKSIPGRGTIFYIRLETVR